MIAEKIICVIFCVIKNLYETISFKKAIACIVVDSPPKLIIEQEINVFILKDKVNLEISKQPFVISSIPFKKELVIERSIPINFNKLIKGAKMFKLFNISVIINATTTIPPISKIE